VVAPTYGKDYGSDPTLGVVWDAVDEALREARVITVLGYSLSPGDKGARERFKAALLDNRECGTVHVISPRKQEDSYWPAFLDDANKLVQWHQETFDACADRYSKVAK
jgi:hypothetical protein